jgi:hypothetical protein
MDQPFRSDEGDDMTTENGNTPGALDADWYIVLLGDRTLLGKILPPESSVHTFHLAPAYQIEMRPTPVQGIDPTTKQPTMGMVRQRYIMAVAEMTGWGSVALPQGCILKPVVELSPALQKEMAMLVRNYEAAVAAQQRKIQIDQQASEAMKASSFGGGARKE